MKKILPNFEVRQGGLTSIDITKKGIDKGYAIKKLMKFLKISKKDAIFLATPFSRVEMTIRLRKPE